MDANGRTIWIADAHRDDGKRFVVRVDEKLAAFVELESAILVQVIRYAQPQRLHRNKRADEKLTGFMGTGIGDLSRATHSMANVAVALFAR